MNKSSDYNAENSWDAFRHCCETKFFPAIAATIKKSVVVLDRAIHHAILDEEDIRLVFSWNKDRLFSEIER